MNWIVIGIIALVLFLVMSSTTTEGYRGSYAYAPAWWPFSYWNSWLYYNPYRYYGYYTRPYRRRARYGYRYGPRGWRRRWWW